MKVSNITKVKTLLNKVAWSTMTFTLLTVSRKLVTELSRPEFATWCITWVSRIMDRTFSIVMVTCYLNGPVLNVYRLVVTIYPLKGGRIMHEGSLPKTSLVVLRPPLLTVRSRLPVPLPVPCLRLNSSSVSLLPVQQALLKISVRGWLSLGSCSVVVIIFTDNGLTYFC